MLRGRRFFLGTLAAAVIAGFGVSCSSATPVKAVQHIGAEKELTIRTPNGKVLKAEFTRVIKTPDGNIKVYKLSFKTRTSERVAYLYKVGDYVFPTVLRITKDGLLLPVKTEFDKPITLDKSYIEGLKKLEEKGKKLGVIYEGKGKPVYVFLDAYCPFCIREMKSHYSKVVKGHRVVLLPMAVHGEPSLKALACIYEESAKEKKPVGEIFLEHFGKFNGNWSEYAKQYQNCRPDKKYLDFVKETTGWAVQNGVKGTPGIIFPTEKGYKLYYGTVPQKEQPSKSK